MPLLMQYVRLIHVHDYINNISIKYSSFMTNITYINISKVYFKNKRQSILSSRTQSVLRNTVTLLLQTNVCFLPQDVVSEKVQRQFPETKTFETPLRKGEYKEKKKREGVTTLCFQHSSIAYSFQVSEGNDRILRPTEAL